VLRCFVETFQVEYEYAIFLTFVDEIAAELAVGVDMGHIGLYKN